MFYNKKMWAAGVLSLLLCGPVAAASLEEAAEAIKKQDFQTAAKTLMEMSNQGNKDAQFLLAMMYENGRGVEKNAQEAVKWYTKAAEQGHDAAQNNLGQMYKNGVGTKVDMKEAVKWFQMAADSGNPVAQYNLGIRYSNGEGVAKSAKKAAEWYRKSAEQNNVFGQFSYAYALAAGNGVDKNIPEAYAWAKAASTRQFMRAQQFVGFLLSKMKPEEIAAGDKRFTELKAQFKLPDAPPPAGPKGEILSADGKSVQKEETDKSAGAPPANSQAEPAKQ